MTISKHKTVKELTDISGEIIDLLTKNKLNKLECTIVVSVTTSFINNLGRTQPNLLEACKEVLNSDSLLADGRLSSDTIIKVSLAVQQAEEG